jgi:hypothetical protein
MSPRAALTLIVLLAALALPGQAVAGNTNGSAGDMPAYYDGQLFTINFKQEPSGGEASTLAHNGSINTIYMSDQAEAAGVSSPASSTRSRPTASTRFGRKCRSSS